MSEPVISESDCMEIRRERREGTERATLSERFGVGPKTIGDHSVGNCSHNGKVEPIEPHSWRVTEEECREMRKMAHEEESFEDIGETFGYTSNTALRHSRGRCRHNINMEPYTKEREGPIEEKLSEDDCIEARLRRIDGEPLDEVADDMGVCSYTIIHHANGHCPHDHGIEAHEPYDRRIDITPELCSQARKLYSEGYTYEEVAEEVGGSRGTIGRHISGECSHDVDVEPIERRFRFSDRHCQFVRYLYYVENFHIGMILNKFEDEVGHRPDDDSLRFHIFGDCHHEFPVE